MLSVFSLRGYFTGTSTMVILISATTLFGRQMAFHKHGASTQLPMEAAYFLDRPQHERANNNTSIYQAHVSNEAPTVCFIQPSLKASPCLAPDLA
jgi:hypothetical protein